MAKKKTRKKPAKKKALKKKAVAKKKAIKKVVKKRVIKGKVIKRKPAKKRPTQKSGISVAKEPGEVIGKVTHYFPHVRAAVIKLKAPLSIGDTIKIKGHTTDLIETVSSIQMDRAPIDQGKKGQEIGLLVNSRVRQHDIVYKI